MGANYKTTPCFILFLSHETSHEKEFSHTRMTKMVSSIWQLKTNLDI